VVLTTWHLDPKFLDRKGQPRALPGDGNGVTFSRLSVKSVGSDVPASTLLRELRDAGAVRELDDGRWEPLMRNYLPHTIDEHVIRFGEQAWRMLRVPTFTTSRARASCRRGSSAPR